ncbi:MAG: hypothetical protein ABH870_05085, partial [bacterium]
PSAISHQPSAISHQPSAISHQPSAISHQPSAISHQPSAISHQPSARGSSSVGIGLISVQKRLFLTNTSRTNLPLIFCFLSLLLILSSKPAIAYELKWSTTIVVSGQQTNGNYFLQGISSSLDDHSSNLIYTVAVFMSETLPPQQGTFTIFTAIPVSSTEEYYSLQKNGDLIASSIPKHTISYGITTQEKRYKFAQYPEIYQGR